MALKRSDRHAEKVWVWPCSSCRASNTRAVPGSTKGGETFRVRCARCGAESFEIVAPANLLLDRRKTPRPADPPIDGEVKEEPARAREASEDLHQRSRHAIEFAELVITESVAIREHLRSVHKTPTTGRSDK